MKEKLKNMKIEKKMLFSFGMVIGISICVIIFLISTMMGISKRVDEIYEGPYKQVDANWAVRRDLIDIQRAINRIMAEGKDSLTVDSYNSFEKTVEEDVTDLRAAVSTLENTLKQDDTKAKLEEIKKLIDQGESIRPNVMEFLKNGKFDEAYDLNYETYLPLVTSIVEKAVELFDMVSENAEETVSNADRMSMVGILSGIVMTIIGVMVAVYLSVYMSKLLTEPIHQIKMAAAEMYKGDMSAGRLITYESEDELGDLADSLRGTMDNLDIYVKEIYQILERIAEGDLTQPESEIRDFLGDFAGLKTSIVDILKKFNITLTNIKKASEQVDYNSTNLEQAAQSLANGTSDQASAIQELTATIDTIASLAEESSKKTRTAYENVKKSAEAAEFSKKQMDELSVEMNRISEISQKIGEIITAIEDIASQTNLLSLNASIEAARAGEAGKGFAVVADQIGKLASDSAKSAVDTRELISKTLAEIEKGNSITKQTSQEFDKVIVNMNDFADVAKDTSDAAKKQAEALDQIREGIEQISTEVQNSLSASEESSAISQSLSEEASTLDKFVDNFKLFEGVN